MEKILYITIGVAGSGKSTYIQKRLNKRTVWLSSDNIREEIFGSLKDCQDSKSHTKVFQIMFEKLEKYLLDETTEVIFYDATNLSRKRRSHLFREAKRILPEITVGALLFLRPLEYLLKIEEDRPEGKKVGEEVILRMYKSLEIPRMTVDCDFIEKATEVSLRDFEEEFAGDIPHDSSYHMESVKEHIEMVVANAKASSKSILVDVARFHDLGKFVTKELLDSGYARYKGHENVSAMYYLAANKIDKRTMTVAEVIFQHMNAHQGMGHRNIKRNNLDEDILELIGEFAKIDDKSKIPEGGKI